MKLRIQILVACAIAAASWQASAFVVDGITYEQYDDHYVKVVKGDIPFEGDLVIPESVAFDKKTYYVKRVASDAFAENDKITSVTFSPGMDKILDRAFMGCTSIVKIAISSDLSLGKDAFNGCTALVDVEGSQGITSIDKQAFYGCTSICEMSFGSNLKEIGASAFECTSLKNISWEEADPKTIKLKIGNKAFANSCLTELNLPVQLFSLDNPTAGCDIQELVIPENCAMLSLYECEGITDLTILTPARDYSADEEVTSANRILAVSNYYPVFPSSLKHLKTGKELNLGYSLPDGSDKRRIDNLENLETLEFITGGEPFEFHANSFKDCKNLREVRVPASKYIDGIFQDYNKYYDEPFKNVGMGIQISGKVFAGCTSLSEESVTNLLDNCSLLLENAFEYCNVPADISVKENVRDWFGSPFTHTPTLKSITFEKSEKDLHILYNPFRNMVLSKLVFLRPLKLYPDYLYTVYGWVGDRYGDRPDLYEDESTFVYVSPKCENFYSYTVKYDIGNFPLYAHLLEDAKMEHLILGEETMSIDEDALSKVGSIGEIICLSSRVPKWDDSTDPSLPLFQNTLLRVPEEAWESYRNAEGWKLFSRIETTAGVDIPSDELIPSFSINGTSISFHGSGHALVEIFDTTGRRLCRDVNPSSVSLPSPGIYLVRINGKTTKIQIK